MGYHMDLAEVSFRIPASEKQAALKHLKATLLKPSAMTARASGGSYGGGRKPEVWYAWTDTAKLRAARTLEEFLEEFRWPAKVDEDGNITGLSFEGEKLGDDEVLWANLAGYVDDGSYIEMLGEDGERWRWRFENGSVRRQEAKVVWP